MKKRSGKTSGRKSADGFSPRVIRGGLRPGILAGPVRIVASPEESRPFEVDAVVVEEDTWLVISSDPKTTGPSEHPIRLMTEMIETRPEPPGSVLTKEGRPLRFLAVVYDVDQDPICREEWIASALAGIIRESERRGLAAVGLPPLGFRHAKFKKRRFVSLLWRALEQTPLRSLKRLWLIAPPETNSRLIEMLKSARDNHHPPMA
ncbi:MAG: hypothetical protein GY859_38010 [Desulfobacterales bacterium]|nr:hypothetical protein [Desulfobacterales bacterium]